MCRHNVDKSIENIKRNQKKKKNSNPILIRQNNFFSIKKKKNSGYPVNRIVSNCSKLNFFGFPNLSFCKLYKN